MTTKRGPGFHVRPGRTVDTSAYEGFTGRWSRLFVPLVLSAADIRPGDRVLDVCTGTGEAAVLIVPTIGASGHLIGVDIAPAMLESARGRLNEPAFLPIVRTDKRCHSRMAPLMRWSANLGCSSFRIRASG